MNSYRQYKKYHGQNVRKYFENQVVWLIENFHDFDGNYGYWYFTHEKQLYGLNGSWPSALYQGMGIGLALMAYHETKDRGLL